MYLHLPVLTTSLMRSQRTLWIVKWPTQGRATLQRLMCKTWSGSTQSSFGTSFLLREVLSWSAERYWEWLHEWITWLCIGITPIFRARWPMKWEILYKLWSTSSWTGILITINCQRASLRAWRWRGGMRKRYLLPKNWGRMKDKSLMKKKIINVVPILQSLTLVSTLLWIQQSSILR